MSLVHREHIMEHESRIRGLGEIAIRVNDLDKMVDFYSDVIGLKILRRVI